MAKQVISPEEFVAEVNKRLPEHHAYVEGTHIFLVPKGANGRQASGYDWEPKDLNAIGAVAAVADQVYSLYNVDPYISRAAHT